MATLSPPTPETAITRIHERFGCLFVEGYVKKNGAWVKAEVTVSKADVLHMSKRDFEQFMLRRLPEFTIDQDWQAQAQGR